METTKGTCTLCGAKNIEVTLIDEVTSVCEDCRDEEYIFCEACEQYWKWDAIKFANLKDGRTICEYCAEDVDEDEIDSIDDFT